MLSYNYKFGLEALRFYQVLYVISDLLKHSCSFVFHVVVSVGIVQLCVMYTTLGPTTTNHRPPTSI